MIDVLIVGSGGREHALGWKIKQSPQLGRLFFTPGNPGTEELGQNLDLAGHQVIADFASRERLGLVIVGPEQPLVDGLADVLATVGVPCFGPQKAAALLEGSKQFAKEVMVKTGVPTARYGAFDDAEAALRYLEGHPLPLVVKADGLAGGKGVTICADLETGRQAVTEAMCDNRFGKAGQTVVIEEFLEGTEASFHIISDGEHYLPLVSAQDHKALYEGNKGPNTGGMGTYAPSPRVPPSQAKEMTQLVGAPILDHLRAKGTPFRGVLFVGLMLTQDGPKVLEYNVRFGDPETQVMMKLIDFDLLPVLLGAAKGELGQPQTPIKPQSAVCVVLAAEGYPQSPRKGDPITGLDQIPDQAEVFHAGTKHNDRGQLVTAGGRVLGVTACGTNLNEARERAYTLVDQIHFDGKHFRKDIGTTGS